MYYRVGVVMYYRGGGGTQYSVLPDRSLDPGRDFPTDSLANPIVLIPLPPLSFQRARSQSHGSRLSYNREPGHL